MEQSAGDECGICLDALVNPVALPCTHKFCSSCLDSWRSKYGSRGDKEKVGRACPLCRKKIPPSKEMVAQLQFYRSLLSNMKAKGDILSPLYMSTVRDMERLEEEVGDWTGEVLDDAGEESLELPFSIYEAVRDHDIQKVLDWLGPPPVDKKRINAKCAEFMNATLVFYAALCEKSGLLSVILQFGGDVNAIDAMGISAVALGIKMKSYEQARLLLEWGAEIDPQHFRRTTMEELISLLLGWGNMKLADLLKSELGGRRCELVNYSTRPELNGKTCVVKKHLRDKDRYKIVFEGSNKKALVPPHNLKRRDRTPTDCGYYITFENGEFFRRDFASKEECQAYVAELEAKSAVEQLARLDISSSG